MRIIQDVILDPNDVEAYNKSQSASNKGEGTGQSNSDSYSTGTGGPSGQPQNKPSEPNAPEGIPDSSLPDLDPISGRLHENIPDAYKLTLEQAQQQLEKVEESIDMRE